MVPTHLCFVCLQVCEDHHFNPQVRGGPEENFQPITVEIDEKIFSLEIPKGADGNRGIITGCGGGGGGQKKFE